jgi:DNA-binding MarR family transcriptional regulator
MIDRLEKAGYAQREKDPTDRRRVIVRPLTERIERDIAPLYASIGEAWG